MKRRSFLGATTLATLGIAADARAQITNINDAINKAGRLRMLSQRVSKAHLALAIEVEPKRAQQVLDHSVMVFDQQLIELTAFALNPTLKSSYEALGTAWTDLKQALTRGGSRKDSASTVLRLDTEVLALAHQGTMQYEAASGKAVGRLVNIAGRQRMLSQRMAKFCLASAMGLDPKGSQTEIGKARTEFLAAMQLLRDAPEATQQIRRELQLADTQWTFFDHGLQRLQGDSTSTARMADVFNTSENLLTAMDRVTGMYSELKA